MKKLAGLVLILTCFFSICTTEAVSVKGYFRKDGTYVRPHYRTSPDGSVFNNYSCIYDGKCSKSPSSGGSYSTYTYPSYTAPTKTYKTCFDTTNGFLSADGNCYCNKYYDWDSSVKKCVINKASEISGLKFNSSKCTGEDWAYSNVTAKCVSPEYICKLIDLTYNSKLRKCT